MKAYPSAGAAPQPDGASKLCLSCHDGTIALGAVGGRTTPIVVTGGPTMPTTAPGYLGTDLSGSHPISFVYDDALAVARNAAGGMPLLLPSTRNDPAVKLDAQKKIQCTTCHDPHDDSNYRPGIVPHFYVKPTWSGTCLVLSRLAGRCIGGGPGRPCLPVCGRRRLGRRVQPERARGPAALPKGCGSCHVGHGTPQTKMFIASQETACLTCHGGAAWQSTAQAKGLLNGTGPAANIAAEFNKASHHPLPGYALPSTASSTFARSMTVTPAAAEHRPLLGLPRSALPGQGGPLSRGGREPAEANLRLARQPEAGVRDLHLLPRRGRRGEHPAPHEFQQQLVSSVDGAGPKPVRAEPASSRTRRRAASAARAATAATRQNILGPHGSAFAPILKANYTITDGQAESEFQYALCYLCHNRSTVLSPSSFTLHQLHVSQQRETCHNCHDSHGSTQYPHLIFFNPKIGPRQQPGPAELPVAGTAAWTVQPVVSWRGPREPEILITMTMF